jgi:glycosyltransferase involved in cell wall biosynthesis
MSNPKVSIIITSYNYASYIEGAIKSALRQTHTNIELIVIDDGSTDKTIDVLLNYKNDKRVKTILRENKGVIYTRNEGVKLSTGDFIVQLDADDTLEPTYIEECVNKAEKENLDIVYTQTKTFGRVEFESKHPDFDLERLKHHGYIHAASLVRKASMKENPYDAYLDKLGNEDWDMFLDMCLDGSKAGLVNKPLMNYRKHTDRKSRADEFEGLYKETLVRHHIWSKQNSKHPDQFWYFSTEIQYLLETIGLYERNLELEHTIETYKSEREKLKGRIKRLESRDIVSQLRKIVKKSLRRDK